MSSLARKVTLILTVSMLEALGGPQLTLSAGEPPFYLDRLVDDPTNSQMSADSFSDEVQARVAREDSENEDLRSVIDDLTIENKILRQMLRERRQQYNPQLNHDKIFEVRTRGLSPGKKCELEAILQRFASTMVDVCLAPSKSPKDDCGLQKNSCAQKVAPYSYTDSTYASMSNYGLTTAGRSNKIKVESQCIRGSMNNSVKSYLQGIPDSLLSRRSPITSERSKMRLVVNRLEQLFTSNTAAPGEHSQPHQQQMVSKSPANAGRHKLQRCGTLFRAEGAREAHIIPSCAKMDPDPSKGNSCYKQRLGSRCESEKSSDGRCASDNSSPDQRPTRPLDLDIHRAQDAEENIEYIRHLGLPFPIRRCDSDQPNGGWVYLNLLINMAQLHTFNVTPDFVRKSISELSTTFELSKDAQMIRWKGHCRNTASSEDIASSTEVTTEDSPAQLHESMIERSANGNTIFNDLLFAGSGDARGRRVLKNSSTGRDSIMEKVTKRTDPSRPQSAFDYKPMFRNDHIMLQGNIFDDDPDIVTAAPGIDDLLSQDPSHNYSGRSDDDGPIIYYKNPLFYCDMSGDRQAHQRSLATIYSTAIAILGAPISKRLPDEEHLEQTLIHDEDAFHCSVNDNSQVSLELAPLSKAIDYQSNILALSASGVGGVVPDDHFMLQVRRKCQRKPTQKAHAAAAARGRSHRLSFVIEEEIMSTNRVDLPASKLPPPSYVMFALSSGSSDGLESDASLSDDPDGSEVELFDEGQYTYSPGWHCVTEQPHDEADPYVPSKVRDSPKGPCLHPGART